MRNAIRTALSGLAAAILAACTSGQSPTDPASKEPAQAEGAETGVRSDMDTSELVNGVNRFAGDIYVELASEDGNIFISPVSLSAAFGLLYPGARGDTASEMADVFGFADGENAHKVLGALLSAMQANDENAALTIANAAWVRDIARLREDYGARLSEDLNAEISAADFGKPATAASQINRWVARNTNDRIKELISADFIDPEMTELVLTNAVWFKAEWASTFDANSTFDGRFNKPDGESMPAKLMRQTLNASYIETDDYQAIELPYRGGDYAMQIILPRETLSLGALEETLGGEGIINALASPSGADRREVRLTLPKFEMEASYTLDPTLKAVGLRRAFTNEADLSGLFEGGQYAVSGVAHKTFLAVDEKGTEAAAATAVGITAMSMPIGPPPVEFRADRPFLLSLVHKPSGAILFIGCVETV